MSPNNIKSVNEIKKEAIEEYVDTLIYKLDYLKPIKANLGCDTILSTFRKEPLLNLISDIKKELCSQTDKPITNADRIRSLSDEELAKFINDIAMDVIGTTSYGTQDEKYTEIWKIKEETIKYLKEEDKISKYRRYYLNIGDTDDFEIDEER